MSLFVQGKTAAIAAIKAAITARVKTLADGTLELDAASLREWIHQQAQAVIAAMPAENRDAATGVLTTIDARSAVNQLETTYGSGNWTGRPDYPTAAKIASSSTFVSAAAQAKAEMEALSLDLHESYAGISKRLPEVISETYANTGMRSSLPPIEERVVETRYYVYTHVNDLGEESAPSPVSEMVEVDQRDTVNISIPAPPTGRFVNRWRFYRSNAGTVNTVFQLLAEGPITTLTGTDEALASSLGEVITTSLWDEPPAKLRGLCEVHTGILAGFYDNTTAFSEPFVPYAWNRSNELPCAHPIVAQQSFGQTLVRMHQGGVDYIGGADPASMSVQTDVSKQVCASARSVCKVDGGVVFASQDGLCLASGTGVKVLTEGRILRDDWQSFNPAGMVCVHNEGSIYLWSTFMTETFALHLPTGRITSVAFLPGGMSSVFETGKAIYGVNGVQVYRLFGGPGARTAVWRSKIAVLPTQAPLAWLVVESDFTDGPVTVKWYGDGELRHTVELTSRRPVRLPPGRWLEHEVEVESKSRWNALTLASTTQELQGA